MKDKVALLVDDDTEFRAITATVLEPYYTIHEAGSFPEAITLLTRLKSLDLLVTDLNIQANNERTGLDVAALFRAKYPRQELILISGQELTRHQLHYLHSELSGAFLSKPFSHASLLEHAGVLLKRRNP